MLRSKRKHTSDDEESSNTGSSDTGATSMSSSTGVASSLSGTSAVFNDEYCFDETKSTHPDMDGNRAWLFRESCGVIRADNHDDFFQNGMVVLAGSAAVSMQEGRPLHRDADLDLWIVPRPVDTGGDGTPGRFTDHDNRCNIVKGAMALHRLLRQFPLGSVFACSAGTISVVVPGVRPHFQIIFTYVNAEELVDRFDFPCTRMYYDGHDVRITPHWDPSYTIAVHCLVDDNTVRRMRKYRSRGYTFISMDQAALDRALDNAKDTEPPLYLRFDIKTEDALRVASCLLEGACTASVKECERLFGFVPTTHEYRKQLMFDGTGPRRTLTTALDVTHFPDTLRDMVLDYVNPFLRMPLNHGGNPEKGVWLARKPDWKYPKPSMLLLGLPRIPPSPRVPDPSTGRWGFDEYTTNGWRRGDREATLGAVAWIEEFVSLFPALGNFKIDLKHSYPGCRTIETPREDKRIALTCIELNMGQQLVTPMFCVVDVPEFPEAYSITTPE